MKNFYEGGRGMAFWRQSLFNCLISRLIILGLGIRRSVVFCLMCIAASAPLFGQEKIVENRIIPLQVGDTIPNELWEMYFPVVAANSDVVQYLSLGDFKDKLIILDFWSTWCGSCIYAFPNNYSLANEFKGELLLMPVSPNTKVQIQEFMTTHKNGKYLPESIMDKDVLKQYFPHRFIPHYVWIYDGKLINVTDSDQLISNYVEDILNGKTVAVRQKMDVFDFNVKDPFDKQWKSLFEPSLVAKTTLTKFVDGIGAWVSINANDDPFLARYAFLNRPLISLYQWALDLPWNYFVNEATEPSVFQDINQHKDWYRENTYCYEIYLPKGILKDQISDIVVNDLNTKLKLNCRQEKRVVDCYVLTYNKNWRNDEELISIVGPTKNLSLDEITTSFNNRRKFEKHSYQSPPILINELTHAENYLLLLTSDISIEGLNSFMKPQGIMAIPAKREIEVFILSDH